jgi:hypothetical protein
MIQRTKPYDVLTPEFIDLAIKRWFLILNMKSLSDFTNLNDPSFLTEINILSCTCIHIIVYSFRKEF